MGYVEFTQTEFSSSPSPRESARFGHSTDRITIGAQAHERTSNLIRLTAIAGNLIRESSAVIKIVRFPSECLPLFRNLTNIPGRLIPAGALMYWEYAAGNQVPLVPGDNTEVLTSPANSQQLDAVMAVVKDSFDGYVNHYSVNPLIPAGIISDGYMEWARGTISNPSSLVFTMRNDDNKVVGAAVISVVDGIWEIELASIARAAQRRGYYLRLISRVLTEAHDRGAARVVISTQSHNIAVQRAWVRLGFSPILSIDTVHIIDDFTGVAAIADPA